MAILESIPAVSCGVKSRPGPALFLVAVLLLVLPSSAWTDTLDQIRRQGEIVWGADAEGGAPYIFPDPREPSRLIGFEVDLMEMIAGQLGVKSRHFQNAWDNLVPALERGDIAVAVNGLEITPDRLARVRFTRPYYIYTEQLVVRAEENGIAGLADLKRKRVGTLSGTAAQDILEGLGGVDLKIYAGQVEPYADLALGRLDAVLLDLPIAAYYARPNPRLKFVGPPAGEGCYGIAARRGDSRLVEELDRLLGRLMENGELKRLYEKWGIWNATQEKLLTLPASQETAAPVATRFEDTSDRPAWTFFPSLLQGALMTLVISVLSMAWAMAQGLVLTLFRLYGNRVTRVLAVAYIEIYRGTPLLLQLYLLYYGLPNLGLTLSAFTAAILGLGMNYAAYEAEIYRAGIEAVPRGQMEAALSLGLSRAQALRRIILPQALRIAIPPVTNDFIALFKDSSLVSVITMVELTKSYSMLAVSTMRFLELGLLTALLYFGMSYPLSLLARRLERSLVRE